MINIELKEQTIFISGDIEIFSKPRIKNWLKTKFTEVIFDADCISIKDSAFEEKEEIINFKKSINHKLGDISISSGEKFDENIKEYEDEEKNFKIFSKNAKQIWENDYDANEFESFTSILKKTLPSRRLYKLQLLSAYHLAFSQNSCNFSVPGSGKTSIVFGAYSYLNNLKENSPKYVNKLLVVGPPSSFDPWIDEFKECFGRAPKVFRFSGESSRNDRLRVLNNTHKTNFELLLFTYNSIPFLIEEIKGFCRYPENKVMFVCDEAHKVKSEDGLWSNSVLELSPFLKSRVILTGTPAPNGYEDLYNLFKFIYPKKNIIAFRRDYLKKLTATPTSSEIADLIESIKPFFVRIKKSDLNLPDFKDEKRYNIVDDLERETYVKLKDALENNNDDVSLKSIYHRLHQSMNNIHLLKIKLNQFGFEGIENLNEDLEKILGGELLNKITDLDNDYVPSKHRSVLKHVLDLSEKNKRVVIWGYYVDSIKRLHKLLKSNGLNGEIIIGETPKGKNRDIELEDSEEHSRQKIIKNFKSKASNLDYIITNPIVLGESVSLHKVCHDSIYFEFTYNAAPYIQSRDRIHRVWLHENKQVEYETNYYHYLSITNKGRTDIDDRIFNRLNSKFNRMLEIIDHDIPLFIEENDSTEIMGIIKEIIQDYGTT